MANTIKDFWRMVWEQNCTVVVMITNIIEKGRVSHACQNYFFVYFYHKMYHRDVKPNGALGQC